TTRSIASPASISPLSRLDSVRWYFCTPSLNQCSSRRPSLPCRIADPALGAGSGQIDRMLGRVDEDAARAEPASDALDEAVIVRDVVDRERAHDQVEAVRSECCLLDGHAQIAQPRMAPFGAGRSEERRVGKVV